MEFNLEQFKNLLRVDIGDDDLMLEDLYHTAEQYVQTSVSMHATVEELSKIPQFSQASVLLAGHWYNSRYGVQQTTSVKVNNEEIPFGVTALIWQVRAKWENRNDNQSTEQSN